MLFAKLKSILLPFIIFISYFYCTLGAIISPVILSSMNDDATSTTETIAEEWPVTNSTSKPTSLLEGNSISLSSDANVHSNSSSFPNPQIISSINVLPTFPTESYSTAPIPVSVPSYFSNIQEHSLKTELLKDNSYSSSLTTEIQHGKISSTLSGVNSLNVIERSSLNSEFQTVSGSVVYKHFHTPLMSLLVASPSIPFPVHLETQSHFQPHTSLSSHAMTSIYNESTHTDVLPETDHKKLLMLVLRAEDCTRLSKVDFEKMLGKLMIKFGFGDAVPEVSNAKCFSHLHINLTVGGRTPTLRFLPNIDDRHNVTVDVLNRTFRVVKLEKIDLKIEKSRSTNASSTIITSVADHESIAYISVGITFGLVLVLCFLMCCIKCCCLRKSQKRFGTVVKNAHVRLRPEDYTLTPIPRPTSLYVDYYRGSVTADIYSTTSAGSVASTTPTVDQGIIQPFDTSIVPLEDSTALQLDSSRDPSVESVPTQSDLKTFNIHGLAGKGLRNISTDSKEQLNPKKDSRKPGSKTSGVANPTFQRY